MESLGRSVQGLALTATAGWVDAVGFVRLQGFYPSFMSGNTTRLGVALTAEQWDFVALGAGILSLFFLGSFCGGLISALAERSRLPTVLTVEAVLVLVALAVAAASHEREALFILPVAMGLQNAAVEELRPGATTFVTGSLFRAGHELARALAGKADAKWLAQLLTWASFAIGAAAGALGQMALGLFALALPFAVLAVSAGAARISMEAKQ